MTRLAIVGFGKIANDEHLPAILAGDAFELVATATKGPGRDGIACFESFDDLLDRGPGFDAVSICVPTHARFDIAMAAIRAGKHVLLEKPPGATLNEVSLLHQMARDRGLSLFASWHTRFAPAVQRTRAMLSKADIRHATLVWSEDVNRWHPGQSWIWQPGGLGVFDAGINGLSLVTDVLPQPFFLSEAKLFIPENRLMPIAAEHSFKLANGAELTARFDWLHQGEDDKALRVHTADGLIVLDHSAERLTVNGELLVDAPLHEYHGIYRRFAELIEASACDVDLLPLSHVADAFMKGERIRTGPF